MFYEEVKTLILAAKYYYELKKTGNLYIKGKNCDKIKNNRVESENPRSYTDRGFLNVKVHINNTQ